jgi:hypothetical protein
VSCPRELFARIGARHGQRLTRWSIRVRRVLGDVEEAHSFRLRLAASSCPSCRVDFVSATVDGVGVEIDPDTDLLDINCTDIRGTYRL